MEKLHCISSPAQNLLLLSYLTSSRKKYPFYLSVFGDMKVMISETVCAWIVEQNDHTHTISTTLESFWFEMFSAVARAIS